MSLYLKYSLFSLNNKAAATANDPSLPLIPALASNLFKLKTNLCKIV